VTWRRGVPASCARPRWTPFAVRWGCERHDRDGGAAVIMAIDGPSASGKSTIGRMLARHLRLPLVDTGLMYRAVTVLALEAGTDPGDSEALGELARRTDVEVNTSPEELPPWQVRVDGRDLTAAVFDAAIAPALVRVSQVAEVRREMVAQQRRWGPGGVVMVGRDIGTVVFPDADLKLFITATEEERKRRRSQQMADDSHALLKGEIADRDAADSGRSLAPLRAASDAHTIETDGRSPQDVFAEILRLIPEPAPGTTAAVEPG
jgi:cytidylate kinase